MGAEWADQCSGDKVGDIDSKEENEETPNSEAYIPNCSVPYGVEGEASPGGMFGLNRSKTAWPFTVENPAPC